MIPESALSGNGDSPHMWYDRMSADGLRRMIEAGINHMRCSVRERANIPL